jgi:hypothetical protein
MKGAKGISAVFCGCRCLRRQNGSKQSDDFQTIHPEIILCAIIEHFNREVKMGQAGI